MKPHKLYKTANGSVVRIYDSGRIDIEFDWFEESACVDCEPYVDDSVLILKWDCDICCNANSVLLYRQETGNES
jgi:hypothetical protein